MMVYGVAELECTVGGKFVVVVKRGRGGNGIMGLWFDGRAESIF